MKKAAIILLAAAMLPALGQAQTVNICDRTPQVRDAIMQAVEANDCAAVDSATMANIEKLDLNSKGLTALAPGDFAGLTSLQWLSLIYNRLAALPEGLFDGLTSLQELHLNNNHLVGLTANDPLFAGLPSAVNLQLGGQTTSIQTTAISVCDRTPQVRDAIMAAGDAANCAAVGAARVTRLDIAGQGLTSLRADDFDGLTSLQYLYLHDNQLAELPEGLFDGLTGLQELYLSGNQLAELPEGVFDGLTSLQWLELSGNQLAALPEGVFDGLTSLQGIWLSGNQLAALPEGLFDGLTSLRGLSLHDNQLAALPEGVFDGLTSLQGLWLSGNQLAALPEGLFDGLTGLQGLYLNNNQLAELPEGLFDGLTSLQELHLNNNHLVGLTANDLLFAGLPSAVNLQLGGQTTSIQTTAISVCDRTPQVRDAIMAAGDAANCAAVGAARVTRLDIAGQGLTSLRADDFDGLTSLQEFSLSNNQLAELPEGLFDGLTGLQELYLSGNQLAELPEGLFDGLTSLQWLELSGNQLAALPEGVFDGLTSLQGIWLSGNQLAALPEGVFDGLTSLRGLSLHDNQLAALPEGVFDGLTSLQGLWLSGNQLAALPEGLFDGLTGLQGLYLNNNQLAELPEGLFDGLTGLQELHLNNNHLVGLTANDPLFAGLPSAVELRLGGQTTSIQTTAISVCDRTPQVRDAIMAAGDAANCAAVGAARVTRLDIGGQGLTRLRADDFDGLTSLQEFSLSNNQLAALPEGLFDGLTSLQWLWLQSNHFVGLALNDPLFAGLPDGVDVRLDTRLAVAVAFMPSASDSMRQGFVHVINESGASGGVRILAFDDGGNAADPVEIQLGAGQSVHFNSSDLENGNANKGIEGVGPPAQGDWLLDIETALAVRVLSFVRTGDGFLTAMHDRLPIARPGQSRRAAWTFNPGSNDQSVSSLRLVNTGGGAEDVSIEGVDDQGNAAGPVALTLAAGEARTLSALDLENGAQGLTGTLGDGAGKWRLFITAEENVVGASLLRAATGHATNLSTAGGET